MANLSQLTLPVKDTITGEVTQQTFNISGSGGGGDSTNFVGTLAQWESLTQAEKNLYDSVDLTDDYYDVEEELQSMADNLYAKQDKTDQGLETASKTVVGAINEIKGNVTTVSNQLKVGNNTFYFDSHDGKYGYNTSPTRGADTFVPFKKSVGPFSVQTTSDGANANHYATFELTFNVGDFEKLYVGNYTVTDTRYNRNASVQKYVNGAYTTLISKVQGNPSATINTYYDISDATKVKIVAGMFGMGQICTWSNIILL